VPGAPSGGSHAHAGIDQPASQLAATGGNYRLFDA
jgi:hypothetical protein